MLIDIGALTFAFSAGLFTLFSPCGFPMLPGYIGYYLGTQLSAKRTLLGGVIVSSGLLVVFSAIGLLASLLSSFIVKYLPFFTLLAGITVLFMGLVLVTGFALPQFLSVGRAPRRKGVFGLFLYGILYGLATISCSAPVFFSILVYAISQGAGQTIVSFAAYALGMATPLIGITVVLAKTRNTIQQRVIAFTPKLQKLAGLILIIVGSYLIYYFFT